jgi:hypothetical protein
MVNGCLNTSYFDLYAVGLTAIFMEELRMARGVYSHEIGDQDFQWLITAYTERITTTSTVDLPTLPVVLIVFTEDERSAFMASSLPNLASQIPGDAQKSEGSIDDVPNE